MAKLPSLQFYPGDWLRDDVSCCSLAAQGLWLRMMIIAHDSANYGFLELNGAPMPPDVIARKCGCSTVEFELLMGELDAAGVPSRTERGSIYSRRMVRDGAQRKQKSKRRSEAGKRGAEARWQSDGNGDGKRMANAIANGMAKNGSSISSSSSEFIYTRTFEDDAADLRQEVGDALTFTNPTEEFLSVYQMLPPRMQTGPDKAFTAYLEAVLKTVEVKKKLRSEVESHIRARVERFSKSPKAVGDKFLHSAENFFLNGHYNASDEAWGYNAKPVGGAKKQTVLSAGEVKTNSLGMIIDE